MKFTSTLAEDIRPEAELLLCCASTHVDSERAKRITSLVQEGMNWSYLTWKAFQHGMMPLLYSHLNALCPEAVPPVVMYRLRGHFNNNARLNLLLMGELLNVLNTLSTHEISAIPYKGPVLAASVYGNLALRESGDLDIVVNEEDVLKTKELLLSRGYRPIRQAGRGQETVLPLCQYPLHRDDSGVNLDIHWRLTPRYLTFPLDFQQLYGRLEPMSIGGQEIRTLAPEDLLLILCIHGSKHLWEQLRWICDVTELIRVHQDMDWGRVMEQAEHLGCERMLFLGLLLARDLLGAAIPDMILEKLRTDSVVRSLAVEARALLFSGTDLRFRRIISHLRMVKRLRDMARYCLYRVPSMGMVTGFCYSPLALSFTNHLLRPVRSFSHTWGKVVDSEVCDV